MNSSEYHDNEGGEEEEPRHMNAVSKKSNILPLWGNERTMNLNPLILTNIQSSHYFKVNLYELKTYHEVIDEIYYKVSHLEPWEKGSRKTAGQTGMCGGVRGVGAGGIVSTAYCLLYKLFTLKLTRKQVNGLITHPDSPYIRVLGFMYIRYTQPPADLWDWYEDYLEDDEEVDVKAGGGQNMTIGTILKNFLCKLEWFSTLFPRIPVPIQQKIERNMIARFGNNKGVKPIVPPVNNRHNPEPEPVYNNSDKLPKRSVPPVINQRREVDERRRSREREREREKEREREREKEREREREKEREREREKEREREREKERERERLKQKDDERRTRDRHRHKQSHRSRSRQRHRH